MELVNTTWQDVYETIPIRDNLLRFLPYEREEILFYSPELQKEPLDFAALLSRKLPGQKIVIACDNTYGLKLLAGNRISSTDDYFFSMEENFHPQTGSLTYSKAQLEEMLAAEGISEYTFFYPYPNYQLPLAVYSDDYLPHIGELTNNERNFGVDRLVLFQETLAWNQILRDHQFTVFSNSYLLVIGDTPSTKYGRLLFTKFSNDRNSQYNIRTDILDAGSRLVTKSAMDEEARDHILQQQFIYETLQKNYQESEFEFCPVTLRGNTAVYSYLEGEVLDEVLAKLYQKKDLEQLYQIMDQFICAVYKTSNPEFIDVDLIFKNIILSDDRWNVIDYEWTFDVSELSFVDNFDLKFVIYRSLYYFYVDHHIDEQTITHMYHMADILEADRFRYARMERQFQAMASEGHISLSEYYDKYHGKNLLLKNWLGQDEEEKKLNVQAYLADGTKVDWTNHCRIEYILDAKNVVIAIQTVDMIAGAEIYGGVLPEITEVLSQQFYPWREEESIEVQQQDLVAQMQQGQEVSLLPENMILEENIFSFPAGFHLSVSFPQRQKGIYLIHLKRNVMEEDDRIAFEHLCQAVQIRNSRSMKEEFLLRFRRRSVEAKRSACTKLCVTSQFERNYNMSTRMERGSKYLREHGFFPTLVKTARVILKHLAPSVYDPKLAWKFCPTSEEELTEERRHTFEQNYTFSILIPMYCTPIDFFKELIASITSQTYTNWELCLADGSGKDTEAYEYICEVMKHDQRIIYRRLESNEGISGNTNQALDMASGDYIVLCDHDDLLEPDALYEVMKALSEDDTIDTLYTDEDKVEMDGVKHFDPAFKPDFNIDFLRGGNYICHMFVTRTKIAQQVRFMSTYDGAQDFDFIFRCAEASRRVYHIPKILYHWRCHMDSTAANPASKLYAYESGCLALQDHLKRMGYAAEAYRIPNFFGYYGVRYDLVGAPLVSLISTSKLQDAILEKLKNKYDNLEFVVADSYQPKDMNAAVQSARGDILFFIDPRMKSLQDDVFLELLAPLQRDDLASTFAQVYTTNGRMYSCGFIVGANQTYARALMNAVDGEYGFGMHLLISQDMSGSDLSCAMVKRASFIKAGGLDEQFTYRNACADFFLKAGHDENQKHLFVAPAKAYIQAPIWEPEERANGKPLTQEDATFCIRWEQVIATGDVAYNPNLSLRDGNYNSMD